MARAAGPGPRERLLHAASELFYREGVGAVGVDRISERAGVSKRTLYQQFASKDDLVAASLRRAGPGILSAYLGAAERCAAPRTRILAVFEGLMTWSGSDGFRGCPFVNAATELADPAHPARAVARESKLHMQSFFKEQARLGGSPDPASLAIQLMIVFDGAMIQSVVHSRVVPETVRAAVEALLDAGGVSQAAGA